MRKKLTALLCSVILCLLTAGCGTVRSGVVYTIYPIGFLIERLAGVNFNAQSIQEDFTVVQRAQLKENYRNMLNGAELFLHIGDLEPYLSVISQDVRSLSGGNQQKVILARELESNPDFLIVAHPTRGLDIGATRFVRDQMIAARERGVGILLISADFDEILEMSDRILVIFEGQIMGEYSGQNPPIEEISLAMTGK